MKTKRITANLPADLLKKTCSLTGRGITETLIEGLELLSLRSNLAKAEEWRGKINLKADAGRVNDKDRR